jgi:hypothetical protein
MFYLLACRDCAAGPSGGPLPVPFTSEAERGRWATEHRQATGHDRWLVWEERRRVVQGTVVQDSCPSHRALP